MSPASELSGDRGFAGVMMRGEPASLPAGMLWGAKNLRFSDGVAQTRKGAMKLAWTNKTVGSAVVRPYGTIYGAGVFNDPNGFDWLLVAADGGIWRSRPHGGSVSMPLPAGVAVRAACTFEQAFHECYCFRGRWHKPLRLQDNTVGWAYLVDDFSDAGVYTAAGAELAWGPWLSVSGIARSGSLCTVTTSANHGYQHGQEITVRGAAEAEFNGRFVIERLGDTTFRYTAGGATGGASGTIQCATMFEYWRLPSSGSPMGSVAVTSLTRAGATATATVAATTGLSNGDYVVVTGANQAAYNGVFLVSNVTGTTFDYAVANTPATPATGTITAAEVARTYSVLPNGQGPLYVNNQLLVPTWWLPDADTSDSAGGWKAKRDYIAASYHLDKTHLRPSQYWRVNQGAPDELVQLVKLTQTDVVAFKTGSVQLLSNVIGDLSEMTRETVVSEYGITGERAAVVVGQNVYFMAGRRGVMSLQQTVQGRVQGADVPLSQAIQPLIERINWTYADQIRMAWWANRLYVAVPLDDAQMYGGNQVGEVFDEYDRLDSEFLALEAGVDYRWEGGGGEMLYIDGAESPSPHRFTFTGQTIYLGGQSGNTPVSRLRRYYTGVNNAVLVYDFVNQAWCGFDQGSALMVQEWFLMRYDGVERLFFLSRDGYVNLYEELDWEDQVRDEAQSSRVGRDWIESEAITRAPSAQGPLGRRPVRAHLSLGTWQPNYTLTQLNEGVAEETVLRAGVTKSRTSYDRPWDRQAWNASNVNDDFLTPYRQDYSVGGAVLYLQAGLPLDRHQDYLETVRLTPRLARAPQLKLTNTQGSVRLRSYVVETQGGSETTAGTRS